MFSRVIFWELRELPEESTKIGKDTFDNIATRFAS